jgi:hypothetical protein
MRQYPSVSGKAVLEPDDLALGFLGRELEFDVCWRRSEAMDSHHESEATRRLT